MRDDENGKEVEFKTAFKKVLKKYIHFEKINKKEISKEMKNELKEMNLDDEIKVNNRLYY